MVGEVGWTPPPVTPSPQELRERVLRGKYRVPFYMSTDCESILRRFLVLNPAKRCTLEVSSVPSPTPLPLKPSCLTRFLSLSNPPLKVEGRWAAQGKYPRLILTPPPLPPNSLAYSPTCQ